MARKAGQGEEEEVAQSQAGEGKTPVRHEEKKPACHGGGYHVVEQGHFPTPLLMVRERSSFHQYSTELEEERKVQSSRKRL
ncbi:hypothetical protein STEG23_021011 [Scotinomys teguina]